MMDWKLLAVIFCVALLATGCTSNKYVKCCVKDKIIDPVTGNLVVNPKCVLEDKSIYGNCDAARTQGMINEKNNTAYCTDGTVCSSITVHSDCASAPGCEWISGACTGSGYQVMPICTDSVPKNCINDKCMAMMCGYGSLKPAPPPSSSDWDANNPNVSETAISNTDLQGEEFGLSHTTCRFETMNRKLYNQVRGSKGKLWVNSFRFGVGKSFSDYEESKYFFPSSDRFCSINPYGTKDRFINYVNVPTTFCAAYNPFYYCSKNGLNYTTIGKCEQNCQTANGCTLKAETNYGCLEDGVAYGSVQDCKNRCSVVSDASKCSNDTDSYKFLEPDGRVKMKYISDYVVGTINPFDLDETCHRLSPSLDFAGWDPEYHLTCKDYFLGYTERGKLDENPTDGPWADSGAGNDGGTLWDWDDPCDGGDWTSSPYWQGGDVPASWGCSGHEEPHKISIIDFDTEYYKNKLKSQIFDPDVEAAFECSGSSQCISGSCNNEVYLRGICKTDGTNGKPTVDCGCTSKGGVLNCAAGGNWFYAAKSTASNFIEEYMRARNGYSIVKTTNVFDGGDTTGDEGSLPNKYIYYVPETSAVNAFFEKCQIPFTIKPLYKYKFVQHWSLGSEGDAEAYGLSPVRQTIGGCPYNDDCDIGDAWREYSISSSQSNYKVYEIEIKDTTTHLGICKVLDEVGRKPFIENVNLGWCEGCTHSTLAVQTVNWQNSGGGISYVGGATRAWRPFMCLQWRGVYNYSTVQGPLGYDRDTGGSGPAFKENWDRFGDGYSDDVSTALVRKSCAIGKQCDNDLNGNLGRASISTNWPFASSAVYSCSDGWYGDAFHSITYPTQPYLAQKLRLYLQSNIMPILDVRSEGTYAVPGNGVGTPTCTDASPPAGFYAYCRSNQAYYKGASNSEAHSRCRLECGVYATCGTGTTPSDPAWKCNYDADIYFDETEWVSCDTHCTNGISNALVSAYNPTQVCTNLEGDGTVTYVIGDTDLIKNGAFDKGYASLADPLIYLNPGVDNYGFDFAAHRMNGQGEIILRSLSLKNTCRVPPLTAIEINPAETLLTLVGSGNLLVESNTARGFLHKFFYNGSRDTSAPYDWRVYNGEVDKYSDTVDMLLITWEPMCPGVGTKTERIIAEFETRTNFTRALMSNFSKPSLVWRFHIPKNSRCKENPLDPNGGADEFLSYLFNHTGDIVDAGMIGIIYDNWKTSDGRGYSPASGTVAPGGGLPGSWDLNSEIISGANNGVPLDNPKVPSANEDGKRDLFCQVQQYSKRVAGITKYTYGQRIVAGSEPCVCQECSNADFLMGKCDLLARTNNPPLGNRDQLFCDSGTNCTMPMDPAIPSQERQDWYNFRCPDNCVYNESCAANLCVDQPLSNSTCRIVQDGSQILPMPTKPFSEITDLYWEFNAGLPAKDKCCMNKTEQGNEITYVFHQLNGMRQQSEFLQFPRRGETEIDCGRMPNTDFLKYCNIEIPISQKEIACWKT